MAVTINNFWGAETGGMEEAASFTGASASTTQKHTGAYSYAMGTTSGNVIDLAPFESIADAGTNYVVGFWFYQDANSSGTFHPMCICYEDSTVSARDFALEFNNTQLRLRDSSYTVVATSSTGVIGDQSWHFIEVYWNRADSGSCEVYANGTQVINYSGDFLPSSGTGITHFRFAANTTTNFYVDDIYFASGATSADDRLGKCKVLGFRSDITTAVPDWTTTLSAGTWDNVQEIPFSDTNTASYTANAQQDGVIWTDHSTNGGPSGVGGIKERALAHKIVCRAERSNGGGTSHYLFLGKNTRNSLAYTDDLALTTSPAIYIAGANQKTAMGQVITQKADDTDIVVGDVVWGPDGTQLFQTNSTSNNRQIRELTLSTAYDLTSTISLGDTLSVTGQLPSDSQSHTMCFSDDGTRLYVHHLGGTTADTVYQYNLSTAWDLSTASYASKSLDVETTTTTTTSCIRMGDSNAGLYVLAANGVLHRWTLSTAKELDSASHDTTTATISQSWYGNTLYGRTFCFTSDGRMLYAWGFNGEMISATLKTAWSLASASFVMHSDVWDTRLPDDATRVPSTFFTTSTNHGYCLNIDSSDTYFILGSNNSTDDEILRMDVGSGLPLSSTEYGACGFGRTSGGRDFVCYEMLYTALLVEAPPAIIYQPTKRLMPFLTR